MDERSGPGKRYWEIFFELFETLPRQGPGTRACAERALGLCIGLPPAPAVLDLGCGSGGQTLYLARMTGGKIVALDSHAPFIERMRREVARQGLEGRVEPVVGDMASPGFPPESFDLIWSEGAFYNLGVERALGVCRGLMRRGGCLAFTDAVWLEENPPPEVRALFADYPTMGSSADILAAVDGSGLELLGNFAMPNEAWWEDFYTPMERRIGEMRLKYSGDPEALSVLDKIAEEPQMHRKYSGCYGYEFFVAKRR